MTNKDTVDIEGADNIVSFKARNIARKVANDALIPNDLYSANDIDPNECKISGTQVPYRPKPGETVSPTELDIKGIYDILNRQYQQQQSQTSLLFDIKQGIRYTDPGPIALYNSGRNTIVVATPNQVAFDQVSDGVATQGYTTEDVHNALGRNAYRMYVINRGPGDLYVIYSSGGGSTFSPQEAYLQEGATEIFFNVYEMRLRSPTAGCTYEVTEYEVPLQNSNIVKAEKIEIYNSVSTIHFTGAIAFNAQETENITGLLGNKYFIRGVNIQSIQPLDFNLIFYSSDVFDTPGVLDTDTFLDSVELDMTAAPTYRINNANQYKLNVSDLNIVYEDTDATTELHVGLQNFSAIAKIAGALGAVQLDFKMSPRV